MPPDSFPVPLCLREKPFPRSISAIWYPEGEHNHVEEIFELLTY